MDAEQLLVPGTQSTENKRKNPVHATKRKRVRNLLPKLMREIPALFDLLQGDYDRVAEDCGVQRADVLAVVLLDTRRKMPGSTVPMAWRKEVA